MVGGGSDATTNGSKTVDFFTALLVGSLMPLCLVLQFDIEFISGGKRVDINFWLLFHISSIFQVRIMGI